MAVSQHDLRRIVAFLHHAAEAPGDDPFSPAVLSQLGELIPAELVEYFHLRLSDRSGLAYRLSGEEQAPVGLVDAFEAFRHQNPLSAARWAPDDGAVRLSADVPDRMLRGLEWYREFLEPMGIRDQLKVWLARTRDAAVCVSLNRCEGRFSDRDATVLDVLQPHLLALHAMAIRGAAIEETEPMLTKREAQVLVCLLSGRDNRSIAEMLFISPHTVRKHLEHAYEKLGVRNRAEAMAQLVRIGAPGADLAGRAGRGEADA